MSAPESITTILRELYEIDPTLKNADESTLVALIGELVASRPETNIREEFVLNLRRKLLASKHFDAAQKRKHSLGWWVLHMTPIGVAAVLLVVLAPTEHPLTPHEEGESLPTVDNTFEYEVSPTPLIHGGADTSAKMSAPAIGGDATMMDTNMDNSERYTQSPLLQVPTQDPGMTVRVTEATLSKSGFIVVYALDSANGRIIGSSPLLPQGVTSNVYIRMKEVLIPGVTYRAQLFGDDGNRVFTLPSDTPLYDQSTGIPYEAFFGVAG